MRTEIRWGLAAIIALAIGATCAQPYARLAAPWYAAVARLIAMDHPWQVTGIDVRPGNSNLTAQLQLAAEVFRYPGALKPVARVIGHVELGEVTETPLVFWTVLLIWPAASIRQRVRRVLVGVPVFFALEASTTAIQLMLPMPQVMAILAGDPDPVTLWDDWSRFLEAGGQFVLACGCAILVASLPPRRARA
ncbi:MAG: hypothetical protein WDM77_01880 [Steroidobacteraceae bacterium]